MLSMQWGFSVRRAKVKLGAVTFGIVYSDSLMEDTVFVQASRVTDAGFDGDYGKFPGKPTADALKEDEVKAYLESPVKKILTIPDVPGYPFDLVDVSKFDAVLIEAFHSGTAVGKRSSRAYRKSEGRRC